ncbi:CcmD family protein [Arcticibacterium luteifluviistationis]|uniref:CcmD family protein n=1 Tax=Arcticibacterium luteifluviistationis TaxID=1784714 RepID=A0A2Z4GB23_9BACT|nr:CcmD family protein [Arcticibacterium luteifluviistationis]AWV98321.1 CcmD family protein [Arcticibacterium luteifluviistationis]
MIYNLIMGIFLMLQQDIEMADNLRSDGKFWIVIMVVAVVTLGIIIYLFTLDRKVRKLEELQNK